MIESDEDLRHADVSLGVGDDGVGLPRKAAAESDFVAGAL